MKKQLLSLIGLAVLLTANAWSATNIIFFDDFESGTLANWTTTSATTPNPLDPSAQMDIVPPPPTGRWSAYMNVSTDRMHHNLIADNGGSELSGHIIFTAWIYDAGVNSGTVGATRIYNELRAYSGGTGLPNGGTTASGSLSALLAAGKFNSVTLPGEVFTSTKYQGRVAFGPGAGGTTGWFNLNDAGSPNRSVGWHRFDIEVMEDGSTVKFYVDGILSRTFTGAAVDTYDTAILGPGVGTQTGDAWIDGIQVTTIIPDTTGRLICPTGAPLAGCDVLVELRDSGGTVVASATTTTDPTGFFKVRLNCANPPSSGSYFFISSPCCGHTWTIPTAQCYGDLGTLVCQECRKPCIRPPDGMVDWWPFDEPAGTGVANDIAGAVNNKGVHVNGPTPAPGKVDGALCFDGIDDFVLVRDHPEVNFYGSCVAGGFTEDFSIDGWLRTDANTADNVMTILDKRADAQNPVGYSLFIAGGKLGFQMADGAADNYVEPTPSITPGIWHLVAVTVQRCGANGGPGLGTLYVDGNLVLTFTPRRGNIVNPEPLLIGRRNPLFGQDYFRGCLDELEFFKRVLTATEIKALYAADSGGKCKPCVVLRCPGDLKYWTCSDGTNVCYEVDVISNCGRVDLKCNPPPCSFFPAGTVTPVTCSATDGSGHTVDCSFTVTVVRDVDPPTLSCPTGIRIESCRETNVTYTVTATDDCDTNVTIVCNPPSGTTLPPGTYVVTCTATDDCQHVSRCEFKVEIVCQPCLPPPPNMVDWWTFDEPAGPIANDIAGAANNIGVHINSPTVVTGKVKNALCFNGDNQFVEVRDHPEVNFLGSCSEVNAAESFSIDTWVRTDGASIQVLMTILDKRDNPNAPQGYMMFIANGRLGFEMADGVGVGTYVEPGASITPGVWHLVAVTVQRCSASTGAGIGVLYVDANPVLNFTPRPGDLNNRANLFIGKRNPLFGDNYLRGCLDELEIFKRALTAAEVKAIFDADSAGKCKPCIRCPNDIVVQACGDGTNVCYNVLVSRECENLQIQCDPPSCSFFQTGTTTPVTCKAVGPGGVVVDRCQFTVTVTRDTTPPQISCPPDMTVRNDPGECGAKVNYPAPQASDNCPGVSVTCAPPPGSFFSVGTTTVTCTATDAKGNSASCTFTIKVFDGEPPRIACPTDITVNSDATRCGTDVNYPKPTATDNCTASAGPVVSCTPPPGFFPVGPTTVVCTATDAAGNTAECKFTITVRDTIPPRITCPPDMRVWTCSPNGMEVQYPPPTVSDNCPGVTVVCNPPSGSPFPPGTNTVTCIATDASGNTAGCRFLVVVTVDREPPRLVCPQEMTVRTCNDKVRVWYPVTATDDCDPNPNVTCTPPTGSYFAAGTITPVTCVAQDACGHKSECTFPVRVVKVPPPHLTIRRLDAGRVAVCWPTNVTGFVLQCAENLNPPGPPFTWINVTNVPVVVGDQYCVIFNTREARHRFYRLCCNDQPWIGHVEPSTGLKEGDVVTIHGAGFGDNPDNLSVSIVNDAPQLAGLGYSEPFRNRSFIPMRAIFASDNMMKARLGPVPQNATKGPIRIRLGIGDLIYPHFHIIGIDPGEGIWTWHNGGDGTVSAPVEPVPPPPPQLGGPCFFSRFPEGGVISVDLRGTWPPDAVVCIFAHLHDAPTDHEYDMNAPAVRLGATSPADCAERIAEVIRGSFLTQAGIALEINVEPTVIADGFRITVRIPDGYIDAGNITICLKNAN